MKWTSSDAYHCYIKAQALWAEASRLIDERIAYGEENGTTEMYYGKQKAIEAVMRHAEEMEAKAKRLEAKEEAALARESREAALDLADLRASGHF
jgi:hypothetical protein